MDLEEVEEIIQRDLPNQRMSGKSLINENNASDSVDSLDTEKPEAATPEFQTLREKYLSEKFFGSSDSFDTGSFAEAAQNDSDQTVSDNESQSDDVIVALRPKESTNLLDDSSQLKTAVISAAEKKVIGQQG